MNGVGLVTVSGPAQEVPIPSGRRRYSTPGIPSGGLSLVAVTTLWGGAVRWFSSNALPWSRLVITPDRVVVKRAFWDVVTIGRPDVEVVEVLRFRNLARFLLWRTVVRFRRPGGGVHRQMFIMFDPRDVAAVFERHQWPVSVRRLRWTGDA